MATKNRSKADIIASASIDKGGNVTLDIESGNEAMLFEYFSRIILFGHQYNDAWNYGNNPQRVEDYLAHLKVAGNAERIENPSAYDRYHAIKNAEGKARLLIWLK